MSLPFCWTVSTAIVSLPLFNTKDSALLIDADLSGADLLEDLRGADLVDCASAFVPMHSTITISAPKQFPAIACMGRARLTAVHARDPSSSVKRSFRVIGEH